MATILVVDDDTDTRALVDALTAAGHEVSTAGSGLDAMRSLGTCRSDLLLIDVLQPVLHGVILCQYLNGHPTLSTIPRVMMSRLTDRPLLAGCVYQGVLEKPFALATALALVTSLLPTRLRAAWWREHGC